MRAQVSIGLLELRQDMFMANDIGINMDELAGWISP
ncbi:hypothetical protein SVI_2478 [Shewanella violacea DSS12]|uniref:Uncharacterized protein n=1 Tax=Shewanella violacea (strain JCM 10179 / CIP 106290 / LMG 19151 / DSS12) TaxID=637905 RepID=D4ZLA0_SHEVD|nr:hypothetical protein SVI_2478 [Shewanella violacea DSS12]